MDELYVLERQEAIRRAQYEARHAEALRKAEAQTRHAPGGMSDHPQPPRHRVSKSATTSPIMRNALALAPSDERGFFGLSNERDLHGPSFRHPSRIPTKHSEQDEADAVAGTKRRLSGPGWHIGPPPPDPPLPQSKSSGHLADIMMRGNNVQYPPFSYHQPHPYRPNGMGNGRMHVHDESPSPISSDSEALPTHDKLQSPSRIFQLQPSVSHHPSMSLDHSPPHYSSSIRSTSEFAFTPSTSPFLGPLRTLNIHSANPSRAPSPILLPPPSVRGNHDIGGFGGQDEAHSHSRTNSTFGSPTSSAHPFSHRLTGKHQRRTTADGLHTQSFSQLSTPQLSSGPSSSGSSPGSVAHSLGPAHHQQPSLSHVPGGSGSGSGTLSASSSRAPSPLHWARGSPPSHHNHHLAHSVRMAFGMTPIHHSVPPSRRSSPPPLKATLPRNTSWSSSTNSSMPFAQPQSSIPPNLLGVTSIPPSRSNSPPIILPPLKTLQEKRFLLNGDGKDGVADAGSPIDSKMDSDNLLPKVDKERVELPRFSEFEASTRAAAIEDARMSVDFAR